MYMYIWSFGLELKRWSTAGTELGSLLGFPQDLPASDSFTLPGLSMFTGSQNYASECVCSVWVHAHACVYVHAREYVCGCAHVPWCNRHGCTTRRLMLTACVVSTAEIQHMFDCLMQRRLCSFASFDVMNVNWLLRCACAGVHVSSDIYKKEADPFRCQHELAAACDGRRKSLGCQTHFLW